MDAAGLPALVEAIRHLHGLEAKWLESVPVTEKVAEFSELKARLNSMTPV
jgi:hypothetical protein